MEELLEYKGKGTTTRWMLMVVVMVLFILILMNCEKGKIVFLYISNGVVFKNLNFT